MILFLMVTMATLWGVEAEGSGWPWDIWLTSEGQEQLLATVAVDFVTGIGFLLATGRLNSLVETPDDWCKSGTLLHEIRPRHEIFLPVFNIPTLVYLTTIRQGIYGDWGLAYLFGWTGATIGNNLTCSLYPSIKDPLLKTALALVLPPMTAAAWSVYGFNAPRLIVKSFVKNQEER